MNKTHHRASRLLTLLTLLTLALISLPALAHPGHAADPSALRAGLLHPLTGLDHLLAMLAVGLWAAQLARPARRAVPLCFLAAMTAGGACAGAGLPIPFAEQAIAASVLAIGLLLTGAARLPLAPAAALTTCFGAFHGFAHVAEAPAGPLAPYAAGFLLTTAALLLAGLALGLLLARTRQPLLARACGAAVALTGLCLIAG